MSAPSIYKSFFSKLLSQIKVEYRLSISLVIFSLLVSILYALMLPNIYRSTAILSQTQSKFSTNFEGFESSGFTGGLSSILGEVSSGNVSQTDLALKTLVSRDFFQILYQDEIFLKEVFKNSNFINSKNDDFKVKPSQNIAYKYFYSEIFNVFKDRKTGFIYLYVDHQSPQSAQIIASIILEKINIYIREDALRRASNSYSYIKEQLINTNIVEVRNILAKLAERELQIMILTQSDEDYAFNVIQSPFVPTDKDRPRKSVVAITAFFILMLFNLLIFVIKSRLSN